jgi:hypothetical protein
MNKSHSKQKEDELPLFRYLGISTPDGTAAQLAYVRQFLRTALKQYETLDTDSQEILDVILLDLAEVDKEKTSDESRKV